MAWLLAFSPTSFHTTFPFIQTLSVFFRFLGKNKQFLPQNFVHDTKREETSKSVISGQSLLKIASPDLTGLEDLILPRARALGDMGYKLSSILALYVYGQSVSDSPGRVCQIRLRVKETEIKSTLRQRRATQKWVERVWEVHQKGLMAFITFLLCILILLIHTYISGANY